MKKYLIIFKALLVMMLMVGAFLLGSAYAGSQSWLCKNFVWQDQSRETFNQVVELVSTQYMGEIDWDEFFYGAIKGMVLSLDDPYSEYFTPTEADIFWDDINGEFEGIGVEVKVSDGMAEIVTVLVDSPAESAGLQVGDIILAIDDVDADGKTVWQIATMIKGESGSVVNLIILRNESDLLEIAVERAHIQAGSIFTQDLEGALWVRVIRFDEDTSDELEQALLKYNPDEQIGVVLDLRGNPGGYFDSAITISDMFLDSGLIVKERTNDGTEEVFAAKAGDDFEDVRLVVLIDEGSASASEILAGALKDNNRAKVVGQPSYGKGSVQVVETYDDGSILKLTIAEWLTPAGVNLRKEGIQPDILVEITGTEDIQYKKAVEVLRE